MLLGAAQSRAFTVILGVPTTRPTFIMPPIRPLPIGKYGALLIARKHRIVGI